MRFRLKAAARVLLFALLAPFITVWTYASPADVAGYIGGVSVRKTTLAFIQSNGRLQFHW